MDIQSLKLIVVEEDVRLLLDEFAPKNLEIEDLRVGFTSEGVRVTGSTPALMFKVSFETLWNVAILEGRVVLTLTSMKVAGVPAGKLRGVLLKVIRDTVAGKPGIVVENEVIRIDVNEVLHEHGLPVNVKLAAVRCLEGSVVIEA